MQELAEVRLTAWVHGYVQGVGFRWWTRSRALELGLTGYAVQQARRPCAGRRAGPAGRLRSACLTCCESGRTPGHVDKVVADWSEAGDTITGFTER